MIVTFKNFVITVLCLSLHSAESRILYAQQDAIPDEWIFVMKDQNEASSFSAQSAAALVATVPEGKVLDTFNSAIVGFSAKMSEKAAKYLSEDPRVDFVEQNALVRATDVTWGLDRIDQRDLGLDNSFTPSGDGEDVVAYIIDTGINVDHVEFGDRATWGTNTVDNDDTDGNGHGTHVAGTVGGEIYGVAKKVELVAVKVLSSSGSGSTAGVVNGINWAKTNAASVIAQGKKATANLSLGGGSSTAMDQAVKSLHESGVVTVVAAGNSNQDACNSSPAREPAVITVASSTRTDARSSFSNYGDCVDIFAPGSEITAAWIGSNTATNTISGTSMASPHVCGGAALLLGSGNFSYEQVTEMLMSSASENKISNPGSGSPNKLLYVAQIGPTPAPTPAPPTPSPTPCAGSIVKVEVNTDNYPGETGWTLFNECTDETEFEVPAGQYASAGTTYSEEVCVSSSAEFSFTITDTYGDGICCSYGSGSYVVEMDDSQVADGGSFTSSEKTTFGSCTTPSPTASPNNCGSGIGPYSVKVDDNTIIKGGEFGNAVTEECGSTLKMFTFNLNTDNYPGETTWQLKSLCDGSSTLRGGPYAHKEITVSSELLDGKYEFTIFDSDDNGICCGFGSGSYSISYDGNT